MKILRFSKGGAQPEYGVLDGDDVILLKSHPEAGLSPETTSRYPFESLDILPPTIPTKIVAVGLNYRDHAKELDMNQPEAPLLFLKPVSALIGHKGRIKLPKMSNRVDYEAELCVVMGKRARNVLSEDAHRYILGYTCLNDVTARDLQKKDIQFTRSKSFDTFCPVGPWIETDLNPANLKIQCLVNGEIRQSSTTSQLIHPVSELVSFVSRIMTLEPGDLIATGTPLGVGPLNHGDEVRVIIEGIGELINYVENEVNHDL